MSVRILTGDCRDVLASLPDASVQCCVTSPPYYGLRDYGVAGQIGLEQTPAEYVEQMVAVFREVRRALRDDGTVWLNLGDSYAANGGPGAGGNAERMGRAYQQRNIRPNGKYDGMKAKDLLGIPWRVAFALQADGWWLRSDIIWAKRNCMPESVRDRPTRAHEYIFLLTKSERYFYDAVAIEEEGDIPAGTRAAKGSNVRSEIKGVNGRPPEYFEYTGKRNKRTVWRVATQPFAGAHFATFPPDLIEPCILAGTSERGCCANCGAPWVRQVEKQTVRDHAPTREMAKTPLNVVRAGWREGGPSSVTTGWQPSCACNTVVTPCTVLDPFGGAGTTGLVADRLGRDAILIELNPAYAAMAERRVHGDSPLFADVAAQ